ncbi:MAG TPA: hypothetical protein VMV90_09820 [Rectinemataceae bacterium]|nr:hypothetical protein [Rectinemataceae bacterium]
MRKFLVAAIFALAAASLSAYPVYYKEQYYQLFHTHYIQSPDDSIENIYWLELAKKADFCNPLYALAVITNPQQWERYRYLLDMHIDLMLIQQHLILGSKFDKRKAYFYNAPWKQENLDSLKIAESAYRTALAYWGEAKSLAAKAMQTPYVLVDGAEYWIDEAARIQSGELDYADIIATQLDRLAKVRAAFEKMDGSTY